MPGSKIECADALLLQQWAGGGEQGLPRTGEAVRREVGGILITPLSGQILFAPGIPA